MTRSLVLVVVLAAWRLAGVEWLTLLIAIAAFALATFAVVQNYLLRRDLKGTLDTQATVACELQATVADETPHVA